MDTAMLMLSRAGTRGIGCIIALVPGGCDVQVSLVYTWNIRRDNHLFRGFGYIDIGAPATLMLSCKERIEEVIRPPAELGKIPQGFPLIRFKSPYDI